jgi:hypothetical protein
MLALAAMVVLANSAVATCVIDPGTVLERVRQENPRTVVLELWDGGACESALLDGMARAASRVKCNTPHEWR